MIKKRNLTVYLYNIVEDEWLYISSLPDYKRQEKHISEVEDATDCYFMGLASEKDLIYISPKAISIDFQQYTQKLMGYQSTQIITPKIKTHLLCEDLIFDPKALNQLTSIASKYDRLTLISYAVTPQFYNLVNQLKGLGLNVYTPEAPEIDCAWTVNFFGSKSGIRQLAQKSSATEPDFIMPEGVICVGRFDGAKIAANKYIKQKGVVIKTNKGSGGDGVLIFRDGELPYDYQTCEEAIQKSFNHDKYWDNYPMVIEDLVNINYSLAGGFPSIEFKIHKNGRIEMLYLCAMQVTPKGKFYGMDVYDDIFSDRIYAQIADTGFYIAEQYAKAGYRGHFDVDMIASKNNRIYVSESNTRNSGGTDVYRILKKLINKDFSEDYYVISRSNLYLPKETQITFSQLLNQLEPLLFSTKTKTGLIINYDITLKNNELIYTIVGLNKKHAYEIDSNLQKTLNAKFVFK